MKTKLFKYLTVIVSFCVSDVVFSAAATEGLLACGGNHTLRNSSTEEITTRYNIRNPNFGQAILVTNVQIYDADGVQVFNGTPTDTDFKQLVPALQTSSFTSYEIGAFLPAGSRPLTTFIRWRSLGGAVVEEPLVGGGVRVHEVATASRLAQSRAGCRSIPVPGV